VLALASAALLATFAAAVTMPGKAGAYTFQSLACDSPEIYFTTEWYGSTTGAGPIIDLPGVAADSQGSVYAVDMTNNRVLKYTSAGKLVTQWGSYGPGDGQLENPYGVAVDSQGNVYVADSGSSRVVKFTADGAYVTKFADGLAHEFLGVAVDSAGNVYVTDGAGNSVQKYDSAGTLLTAWGTQGSEQPGQFNGPVGVAVDSQGNVYVADSGNYHIQKFDSSGAFITQWGGEGTGDGLFNHPLGVVVDSADNVYVADYGNKRVQKFNSSGTFINKWGTAGTGEGQFAGPGSVAVDPSGNVYVGDRDNPGDSQRVEKFSQGAPAAAAGADQTFSCATVPLDLPLDGTASTDPTPNDALTYAWSEGATPLGTGATLQVSLSPGTHVITLTVTDSCNHSSTDTVTLEVSTDGCNTPPDAVNDAATVAEDSGANAVNVLANDKDPDPADTPTVTARTNGAHGTVAITAGGTGVSYTPKVNYYGPDSFTYTIGDGHGGTDTATVSVTVTAVNDPPAELIMSGGVILENAPAGTTVATFTSRDADNNTFTYQLAAGDGSADNSLFAITGNTLKTAGNVDYETGHLRSIRVRTTDPGGLSLEKTFTISVSNVIEKGKVSFSARANSVSESAGTASVTLRRTDAAEGQLVARISAANVTASPADHAFGQGHLDASFNPAIGAKPYTVEALARQPDGKLVVSGYSYNGSPLKNLVRFNQDGSLDTTFNAEIGEGRLNQIAVLADGKILISGYFSDCSSVCRNLVARLNPNGSLDTSFNANLPQNQQATATLQPDGRLIVSGSFTNYNGTGRNYIVRLNADGSLDPTFNTGTGPNNGVSPVALQPDGKIVIGGSFTAYNGTPRHYLARLNADGSLDTTFDPGAGPDSFLQSILPLADGKILISGYFTFYNGLTHKRFARLNADASLDKTFTTVVDPTGVVRTMLIEPDNKIIIGGTFLTVNGYPRHGVARLNPNGLPDLTFDSSVGTEYNVFGMVLQPDGKIVIGGGFSTYDGVPRNSFARLNGDLIVTWADGDAADKTVQFPITEDLLDEPNETLTLSVAPLTDGAGVGDISSQTVTIVDNDLPAPVASNQSVTTPEDAPKTITLAGSSADGAPLTYKIVTTPAHGTLGGSGTVWTYTPAKDYSGPDSFQFKVNDGRVDSANGTVSIAVNEAGLLRFSAATYSVNEATATATVTVSRAGGSGGATSVRYSTSNGTATGYASCASGKDYVTQAGTLSWAAGDAANKTFTISVCPDAVFEGGETINLALSGATGGADLGTPQAAALTIVDDETQPKISINNVTVMEGNSGSANAVFTVKLSGASSKAVTVNYQTANVSAAAPADYTALPLSTLTFAPGETAKTVTVPVNGDLIDELDETFRLTLTGATSATILTGQATCTIKDNDAASLSISNVTVTEPDSGTVNATFTVNLSVPSSRTVTVKYQTADGTAAATADYTAIGLTTLSFSPGQTTKTVTVQVKGETLKEASETLFVNLSGATNASVSDPQGQCTILNDD
jgi:uncharacterized delta-60 repeat protein